MPSWSLQNHYDRWSTLADNTDRSRVFGNFLLVILQIRRYGDF
jgi:hypothetical protein